ncbi:phosphoglycolate phosphatase, bacterial [Novosphingobium marinum]|uniref:Phosphoglycolate phosphatase n=1 Tax=Novosphingobium marinum TaxID=1514948 RepID=A0A7Z0BWM6_9SPHN|nr:HAD-IA family hydrolase [Novosphingobium marinum]NYH96545.1 phosphoglycolate phosphatase [Novosphingobium marinum]GGC36072.1 phosphoglycolate phosphatase, bacterial [Novosphingobium marinum]
MNDFPFDIVGFDLDGTLLDTHGDLADALNHAMAKAGRPPVPHAETRDLIGGGSKKMLGRALDLTGGRPSDAEFGRLHAALLDHYSRNIANHTKPFPGAVAALDALQERGVRLAVVTNKYERFAREVLGTLGLAERFFVILGGDTLGPERSKPSPDLLIEMTERGGSANCAYVGDTTYDTQAARAAGMPCVAVRFGFCDREPEQLGADALIDHFDDLIPALASLSR